MEKGLLMINTGNGKGKTTAALGQVLRALGHGYRVCVIQFIKGSRHYGELTAVKRFEDLLDFHVMGRGFTFKSENLELDREIAGKGWVLARTALASGDYFLLVLDEFTYLLNYHFVDTQEVLKALSERFEGLHVMITGRNAPAILLDMADLVTEMNEIKHPYKAGVPGQQGIEF